jgi:hypothetical protein
LAANDDLPRGWQQFANAGSTIEPTITYPAVPGVAWVLTHVDAAIWGTAAADVEIVTVNGTQIPLVLGAAAAGDTASGSWDGKLGFPPGAAVVVALSGAGANRFANLGASAYPI